ncbi:helix-turn-helix domain-containing protein [Cohnella rhizosphaerae]|uniref:Helix-turn-helix domain-containing protein n=1 Tax=Cohnella rhizosphaerae TaxID=1457232 RepID=A0A9X4KU97_9BACL|nr:helix-turn-helix domain-containing protein [Cohnella rhizosphaerae]MDG0810376.1 helix-turn-helix domain-containing protein [Cohnella rhizosphaerae]
MYHSLTSGFQWSSSSIVQIDTIRVNAALIYWVLAIEIMNETDASSDRIAHLEAGLRRWEKQTSAFKDRVLLLHDDARRPVLVFSDYEPGTDAVRLRLWAAIKAELESALGAEMNIGVGDAATSVAALPRAFQEAKQSAERMFYADAPGVYAFYPYAAAATNLVDPFEEAKVVEAVKLGKHGEAADLIVNAFERIKRSGGDKTALLAACNRLLGQLDPAERATETFETVSRLRDWMLERLASVSIALNKARKSPDDQLIDKIVAYCANRMGEDITLQQVAEFAGYNKAYFSSFFKKKVGESFWDYLTGVRMAKAKELLETTTLAAHEIGKLVGYHNPSHFGKMFKQAVGRTPAEYKNNMTGIVR